MRKYEALIKDIIYTEPRHLTAEEIYLELKQQEPKVVLATVYNNLSSLYQKGLIHKVTIDGMPERYDVINKHDHLLCVRCGRLSDIKLKNLTKSIEKQVGQSIVSYELIINYVCPLCREKEQK